MQFAVASTPISSNPFLDNFWFADNSGVFTRLLDLKCRAPLLYSYQISTS